MKKTCLCCTHDCQERAVHWFYWNSHTWLSSDVIVVKVTSSCNVTSPWVPVENFQNPKLSKFKLLNRWYAMANAYKIKAILHLIGQLS